MLGKLEKISLQQKQSRQRESKLANKVINKKAPGEPEAFLN
jgi:hypothetical protein